MSNPPPYIPMSIVGPIDSIQITDEINYWYPWIAELKNKSIYLNIHAGWKPDGGFPDAMPNGYEYYIVSGDSLMFGWAEHIINQVDGHVIQLMQSIIPDGLDSDRITYLPYNTAHRRYKRILSVNTPLTHKDIKYKASALTNRITQSKIIIFSALMDLVDEPDRIVSLNHQLFHVKNVHNWQASGNEICDYYTNKFKEVWEDVKISLPDDDRIEGSFNNPAYRNSALNFTQESYHYSLMFLNGRNLIQPGPFVTEKTWKCLASKTAFIPVGQYHTYKWLRDLGLKFDYGELDLEFDNDPGNLTRLEKLVELVRSLSKWSAMDLYEMTKDSTEYNYEYLQSEKFWNSCDQSNQATYNILNKL